MSHPGKHLQIRDHQRGIAQGLGEHALGVLTKRRIQLLLRHIGRDKGGLDAHFGHGLVQKVEGTAVNGRAGHHMVPAVADIVDCHQRGRLTGSGQKGAHAALQRGDFLFHRIQGGVAQTGIEEPALLQVKQIAHGLGIVVCICCALHNRQYPGFPVSRGIPGVDTQGITVFGFSHTLSILFCSIKKLIRPYPSNGRRRTGYCAGFPPASRRKRPRRPPGQ